MKKGLLLCSGGISTTIIAQKLTDIAENKIEFEARGIMTDTSWMEYLEDYSIILISPQIKSMYKQIEKDIDGQVEMIQVPAEQFNNKGIIEFWENIKEKF